MTTEDKYFINIWSSGGYIKVKKLNVSLLSASYSGLALEEFSILMALFFFPLTEYFLKLFFENESWLTEIIKYTFNTQYLRIYFMWVIWQKKLKWFRWHPWWAYCLAGKIQHISKYLQCEKKGTHALWEGQTVKTFLWSP